MFEGKPIQEYDIDVIGSVCRNPIIADLFHHMKFMERRGSGLKKILNETAKFPGYSEQLKPEFYSTPTDFRMVLKNVNYDLLTTPQDNQQVTPQDNQRVSTEKKIMMYCKEPHSRKEIALHCGYKDVRYFSSSYLHPLMALGKLLMTIPDKPNSRYITAIETK